MLGLDWPRIFSKEMSSDKAQSLYGWQTGGPVRRFEGGFRKKEHENLKPISLYQEQIMVFKCFTHQQWDVGFVQLEILRKVNI